MRTFIENYLHFMKNCIRPHYEKLKPLKSGFIENSNFENNRDPCIYRKNRLILPRAVIPVRGVDQEEHEFLSFADQSGMQHNERINKFLNQQQHQIH